MDLLSFLYNTVAGRVLLKMLSARAVSKLCGNFLDSRCSAFLIKGFVRKNSINLQDYQTDGIKTFNEFFRRKIKDGLRPFDMQETHLCAPCDGLLSVWKIEKDTIIPVKQSEYTVTSLLKDEVLAKEFEGGLCLVFRLCVDNYHRYSYADGGKKGRNIFIPGVLHTVRPVALRARPVFAENCREYTLIESPVFGRFIQMEVGAMLVGRIVNLEGEGTAVRGREKGFFEYGGSTVILLLKRGTAQIKAPILQNSALGIETPVKMGEVIGTHE
ncbi:MAG: phosphatidylserine decarboxylase [Spirochaetaceae bacterium]|nr:phosphatidylserine decarboxylase [Spirochaetaceae bacterium]